MGSCGIIHTNAFCSSTGHESWHMCTRVPSLHSRDAFRVKIPASTSRPQQTLCQVSLKYRVIKLANTPGLYWEIMPWSHGVSDKCKISSGLMRPPMTRPTPPSASAKKWSRRKTSSQVSQTFLKKQYWVWLSLLFHRGLAKNL